MRPARAHTQISCSSSEECIGIHLHRSSFSLVRCSLHCACTRRASRMYREEPENYWIRVLLVEVEAGGGRRENTDQPHVSVTAPPPSFHYNCHQKRASAVLNRLELGHQTAVDVLVRSLGPDYLNICEYCLDRTI